MVMDLNKQQKLDTDPKAMHQIKFTGNFDSFSLLKKQKTTTLGFSKGTVNVLWFYFVLK